MGIPQPAFYLFVCSVERPAGFPKGSCIKPETRDLFSYLTEQLMRKGIIATVQPVQTSCQGRCNMGPVMLVEPGHQMYVGLDKAKIDRIVEEHILGGVPVAEYLIPETMWDEAISPAQMKARAGV